MKFYDRRSEGDGHRLDVLDSTVMMTNTVIMTKTDNNTKVVNTTRDESKGHGIM